MTVARAMLPEDLYRITFAGDAVISPDGRRVAYVQTRLDEEADDYRSSIWVVDADGGEAVQFTNGPKRDSSPRWSADGRWLAFLSNRDGDKNQVWVMPTGGGEARQLTKLRNGAGSIAWSPDSRRIAFTSRVSTHPDEEPDDGEQASVNGSRKDGANRNRTDEQKKTARARVVTELKYKLNGEGFTYDRRPHIFVVDLDGGEPRQITDGDYADQAPAWSPDGRWIAFSSARHAERDYDSVSDIFLVPAEGGEPRLLTPSCGPSNDPAFSPDGRRIAYFGHQDPHAGGARNTTPWVVSVDGGEPMSLAGQLDRTIGTERPPAWSQDGHTIYAGVADRGAIGVRAFPVDGSPSRLVVGGRRAVSSWSLAADGSRIAFTASEPTDPGNVFIADGSGANERRLTDLNADWKQEVCLAQPEAFRYESVDGWTVEGWVMLPFGREEGIRYPTLLNVHGGPHMYYSWGFFDEFQVQAGAGYAVVYTNPRGSQSYGEEFAYACTRDWGGKDYQDVMNGLDAALRRFDFLDRDRLAVLGGSYGGFMTSWIIGHSDRFKAAVSERAVNALYSMFGSSDIGFHFQRFEVGGTPQEVLDFYIERSPVTYAAQMTTPLLIVHSENDLRCPIEQAEQLFVTLKTLRRTEVVFVRFPEENHELSRSGKPSRRVERFHLILDWFDRFLRQGETAARDEKLAEVVGARG